MPPYLLVSLTLLQSYQLRNSMIDILAILVRHLVDLAANAQQTPNQDNGGEGETCTEMRDPHPLTDQGANDSEGPTLTGPKQMLAYLEHILERFRDKNYYCRARALICCQQLAEYAFASKEHSSFRSSKAVPLKALMALTDLTVGRLQDKSSRVRQRAIQLLISLLRSHPYVLDGGILDAVFFEAQLAEAKAGLEVNHKLFSRASPCS